MHTTKPQTVGDAHDFVESISLLERIVFVSLAGLFLVLATLGIVLPGLPTTPFLLLTSYFLARSSPKLHSALLANRLFGPILSNWEVHRAIERKTKVAIIGFNMFVMALLAAFSNFSGAILATLFALIFVGLVVVCRVPTVESERSALVG